MTPLPTGYEYLLTNCDARDHALFAQLIDHFQGRCLADYETLTSSVRCVFLKCAEVPEQPVARFSERAAQEFERMTRSAPGSSSVPALPPES